MSDEVSQGINEHLEQENARLEKELEGLRALLSRPVSVTVQSSDANALNQVVQYLPQLTHIATNLSYVGSAVQAVASENRRIVDQLDKLTKAIEEKA